MRGVLIPPLWLGGMGVYGSGGSGQAGEIGLGNRSLDYSRGVADEAIMTFQILNVRYGLECSIAALVGDQWMG